MDFNSQKQTAGDGAQQNQGNVVIVNNYNGISAEELSAVLLKQGLFVREQCTEIANQIVDEKLKEFDKRLMSVFTKDKSLMNSYKKPAFQILTREAQLSAIVSERDTDLDLLTQLLVCHVKKGKDLKTRSAIHQATKIVSEIDNDALCGLTAFHAFEHFAPENGICGIGLNVLNNLFQKILYQELPTGFDWLDQLDGFKAIRIVPSAPYHFKMQGVLDYYRLVLNGYLCVGLKIDSDEYNKALFLLESIGFKQQLLIPNECLDGYVRIPIVNEKGLDKRSLYIGPLEIPFNNEQGRVLRKIWEMYSQDPVLKRKVEDSFMKKYETFDTLRTFKLWWEGIQSAFNLTKIGRVLAHTNAKRCDPHLPDLV